MSRLKKTTLVSFVRKHRLPLLAALASGLYPVLFYYTNNYSLASSVKHVLFFIGVFIVLPVLVFFVVDILSKKAFLSKLQPYLLPFLNVFTFLMLLQLCVLAELHVLLSLGIGLVAILFAVFLNKQFKKVITLQLLLAGVAFVWFLFVFLKQFTYSNDWMQQPDAIEQATFKKKPNIYYIQPDGYVNFEELKRGYYQVDNSPFETFLVEKKFKFYDGFRTNYNSTLYSNTSIFMMKHHYYRMNATASGDPLDARNIIVSENSVLKTFQHNNYRTFLISEKPYFLASRPAVGYDEINFEVDDVSLMTTGMEDYADVVPPLQNYILQNKDTHNFFFIQIFQPGHITNALFDSQGVDGEREIYLEELEFANAKLQRIIDAIITHDPDGMIVIMADHGGYVGFSHTRESMERTKDRDLVYSIFSSALAIRWPENQGPEIDVHFKSSVNLFRILFSYLSENDAYLEHLEEDASFIHLQQIMARGIYKYIDGDGEVTFKKQN